MKFISKSGGRLELIDEPSIYKDLARRKPFSSMEDLMLKKALLYDFVGIDTELDEKMLNEETAIVANNLMENLAEEHSGEDLYGYNKKYCDLFGRAFEQGYGSEIKYDRGNIGNLFSSYYRYGENGAPDGPSDTPDNLRKALQYTYLIGKKYALSRGPGKEFEMPWIEKSEEGWIIKIIHNELIESVYILQNGVWETTNYHYFSDICRYAEQLTDEETRGVCIMMEEQVSRKKGEKSV